MDGYSVVDVFVNQLLFVVDHISYDELSDCNITCNKGLLIYLSIYMVAEENIKFV